MTIIARFEVTYYQFLDEQSSPTQPLPDFAQDPQQLIALYKMMVLTRTFDTKAINLQRTGKLGTFAATTGQEAVAVALGSVMKPEDVLCPDYRQYGAQLQRGVKMAELFRFWGGDEFGNCYADNAADFPICVPISTQCLHATGAATAFKYRQQPRVAVAVCGDGGTSEGDFYEALNVAGSWQLPAVFVVNNNQWAISVPRSAQTHTQTIAQKAIAAGFAGIQVDGNDIIALRQIMAQALAKARSGSGPTLIEALTYRLCDHTTADDANRYRDKAEVTAAWQQEPIARLRNYLLKINAWSPADEEQLLTACAEEVEAAAQEYLSFPLPAVEDMFDYHYANCPEALIEQRNHATAFKGSHHG